MERLTNKKEADTQRQAYEKRLKNGYPRNIPEERFLKLAAYEDIGLSPETVSELLERSHSFYHTVDGLDLVDPVHFGAFLDRVLRWCQAEKAGRLVVLPCKPGQTIWVESWIRERATSFEAPDIEWIVKNIERFGTEIFLTREEAEAALKKREEADNEAD